MDFRVLDEKDMNQQKELMRYAFEPKGGNYNDLDNYDSYYKPVTFFGMFDGDVLASTLIIIYFYQRVRGATFLMAGIAGVATKPEYRRKGLVRTLFEKTFEFCQEKEMYISTLYPFKYSYYEQFGYVWVDSFTFITGWLHDLKKYEIENYSVEEEKSRDKALKRIQPLYEKYYNMTNGLINRNKTTNCLSKRLDKGFFFFSKDESGTDTGYLVTWFIEENILGIREMFAPDVKTRKVFWNFIQLHEGHRKYFKILDFQPHEIQTYPYLNEPRVKKAEYNSNSMLRIINIEQTLNKLHYPNITTDIFLDIRDDFCTWNSGIWHLTIKDSKGIVEKSNKTNVDLSIEIKGLAQLIAGFRNSKELTEQELIDGKKEDLDKIDLIFPKDWFIVRDWF